MRRGDAAVHEGAREAASPRPAAPDAVAGLARTVAQLTARVEWLEAGRSGPRPVDADGAGEGRAAGRGRVEAQAASRRYRVDVVVTDLLARAGLEQTAELPVGTAAGIAARTARAALARVHEAAIPEPPSCEVW